MDGKTPRALRICYLADFENIIVRRYAGFFARLGHEVHVLHCPMQMREFEEGLPSPGITVHEGLGRPTEPLPIRKRMREVREAVHTVRALKPDVVHLLCARPAAQIVARFCGHKVVFTPWGADILHHVRISTRAYWTTRLFLTNVRAVVAGSHAMLRHTRPFIGPARYVRAQWGVDFDKFKPAADRKKLRRELGLDEDAFVLFSPRQWGPKYHIETIIRAIPRILETSRRCAFVFKYCIDQGTYRDEIERLIQDLGLRHAVRILGPSASQEESHATMARLFAASDAFFSIPSWDGGTPVTIFEGAASGCVPIVSDIDTNTEFIVDGETGYVVQGEVGHIELASKVSEILKAPEELERLRATLPAFARSACHLDTEMSHVLEVYRNLTRDPTFARREPVAQEDPVRLLTATP